MSDAPRGKVRIRHDPTATNALPQACEVLVNGDVVAELFVSDYTLSSGPRGPVALTITLPVVDYIGDIVTR